LRETSGNFFSIHSGWSIARDVAGKIKLREQLDDSFNVGERGLNLQKKTGQAEFGGLQFTFLITKENGARGRVFHPAGTECFDAAKVGGEIILRHWRAGDRFQPIGMKMPVKLQDLFVNAKIPRDQRRKRVVATTAAGEIFWVQGLRMSERFKLTAATRRRLVWAWSSV
jgi:tRNA(Ile)-lysidine synthase